MSFALFACNSDLKKARKAVQEGEWASAQESMIKAINSDQKNPKLHNELGYIYEKRKYYELAEKEYHQAMSLDPGFVDAHYNHGSVLFRMYNYAEAIQEFEWVLKYDPNNAKAMNNLALALQMYQNDQPRAKGLFLQAIKLDPENPTYHENLGRLYETMGQSDAARDELNRAGQLKARSQNRP